MTFPRRAVFKPWLSLLLLCAAPLVAGCNGFSNPGRMDWVQPVTTYPRVGTAYCIRGWSGIYSRGIDEMAWQLGENGVHALIYMPEQHPQLAKSMADKYKDNPSHEPIVFIGHSRGVDSSVLIARELKKANVKVDLIVALDSVDEAVLPANVQLCYNYWMPGVLFGTNLLRGIPLEFEPGSAGTVYNFNLDTDYRRWRGDWSDHITMDDDKGIQKRIVNQVLAVCVERSRWTPGQPPASPPHVADPSR
jgi:hypothetical protein